MTTQVEYTQVMELVNQLPEKDIRKLLKQIQDKYGTPIKKRNTIQDIILQAPTWTDEDYEQYLEVRKHINQSRLG